MLPIIIGIAVILLTGTTVALNWDDLMITLKGKRLAILGARGVGKTHLIQFLSSGTIPDAYRQTEGAKKSLARRFQLKDLDLKIKDTLNVAGDKSAYSLWKRIHDEADFVFYLLRADRLIAGDSKVESRIREDMRHIGDWLKACKNPPCLFIIGTHCDFDPAFSKLTPNTVGDYVDNFRKLPTIVEIVARAGGTQNVKVTLGSMKTIQDTEALVYETFSQILL